MLSMKMVLVERVSGPMSQVPRSRIDPDLVTEDERRAVRLEELLERRVVADVAALPCDGVDRHAALAEQSLQRVGEHPAATGDDRRGVNLIARGACRS